jgi:phosphotransferase system, enzyme I, PtsP
MLAEVRDILREVRTSSNLDEALAVIVRRIKGFLPVDASAVYLTDVDTDEYVLMASSGLRSASIGRVRADRHAGLLGLVGERRELVVLTNATAHPRYRPSPETAEEHYDTFLGIPLIHYHHVLGLLTAWKKGHAQFDKDEVTFFVTIAAQLAKLIHEAAAADEVTKALRGEAQETKHEPCEPFTR